RGDRAGPQSDPAGVDARVAVDGEDAFDTVQDAGFDGVGGAAGQDLLGGLEEQAYGAGQPALAGELRQDQSGAEDDGGVDVVAAGVGAAGDRGGVRHGLGVGDGEGVDVGAERQQPGAFRGGAFRGGADVADEAGAGGQYLRAQTGPLEA